MTEARSRAIAPRSTSGAVGSDFLGAGWAFPLRMNVQGGVQISAAEQSIEESIWIILRTEVGERIGNPEFGSRLMDFAFAPLNASTLVQLCIVVEDALVRWEPRIVLADVQANPNVDQGRVDLVIHYHVGDRPLSRSLVYPFYLQPEGNQHSCVRHQVC